MGSTSVRRNLFHHNLSRRPVSSSPPKPLSHGGNHDGSFQSRVEKSASSESAASTLSAHSDNGDIVVKDKNGRYELDVPVLAPILGSDEDDEMNGVEEAASGAGAGVGAGAATGTDSTGDTEIGGRETEKIEASLMEMMCRNRNRQLSNEPAEILNLIHQSLQNKVASLEEDNWMFEPENDERP